jgi:hypothetical protein
MSNPPPVAPHDAFVRVSAALRAVWPTVRDQTAGLSAVERNLLLDHCGSDHRPLVDLLLDIGAQVRPQLQSMGSGPKPAAVWATMRAPLVHRVVSTRYLQPEVARWAVDVWGSVLGQFDEVVPPAVAIDHTTRAANSHTTAKAPAPARRPVLPRMPGTRPAAPRPAAPPPAPRSTVVTTVSSTTRVVANRRAAPGLHFQRVERMAAAVLSLLLLVITVSWSKDLRQRRSGDAPLVSPEVAAAPALPPAEPTVAAPNEGGSAFSERVVTGSLLDAGVGGRYLVTARVQEVSGTKNCQAVAEALGIGRESVEFVTHEPGSARFALPTRDVAGTLDADGWFTAYPRAGTTDNINWQFRMRGRFAANGFSALSETYTSAVLRWGRSQHCVVTAELTGRRLPD